MRPHLPIKACVIAACTAASALLVLPAPPAGASEAGNPFAAAAPTQASPPAAKPASGTGTSGRISNEQALKALLKAKGATVAKSSAGGATSPLQAATPTTSTSTSTTKSESSTSESGTTGTSTSLIVVLIAAALLLVGVAYAIVRDARSVAPVVEGAAGGGTRNPEGRLRKRRAQAKAARVQRKRHRKR